jgi:hypothetical protein
MSEDCNGAREELDGMVRGISQDKAEWLAVMYVQPLIQKLKALGYGLPEEADGSRNQEEGR